MDNVDYDLRLAKRLYSLDPEYSAFLRTCIKKFNDNLDNYLENFSGYSDHTLMHSSRVINNTDYAFHDIIDTMNKDEILIYLIACYSHDYGMGINVEFYIEHRDMLVAKELRDKVDCDDVLSEIRQFHNFISASYLRHFAKKERNKNYFEQINTASTLALFHRKADVYDESLCPITITLSNGSEIRVRLLCIMLRLCDAMDIGDERVKFIEKKDCKPEWYYADKCITELVIADNYISFTFDSSMSKITKNNVLDDFLNEFVYCKKAFKELCNFDIKQDEIRVKFK